MLEIPQGLPWLSRSPKPCWVVARDPADKAVMACANGHIAFLTDHEVAADGTVTPSIECTEPGCGFHEKHCRLVGWPGT